MMLPGYALVAQGTQIHAALWPGWEKTPAKDEYCWARQLLLSRAFASQAAAYVVCSAGLRRLSDIPSAYAEFTPWEHTGHSYIIDPRGEIIAGPMEGEGILYADGDLSVVRAAKAACDIAGHYSRPDVFEFDVDLSPRDGAAGLYVDEDGDDDWDTVLAALDDD